MDKSLFIVVLIVVVAVGGIVGAVYFTGGFGNNVKATPLPEGIVLFYGDGCSHCKDVEDFMAQNKIEEKVKITKLEVWYNKSNALLLGEIAKKCGVAGDTVGVPFLYDGEKCYIGEDEIPNFLKIKAGIN